MARAAQGTGGPSENKKTCPKENLEQKNAGKGAETAQEGRKGAGVLGDG